VSLTNILLLFLFEFSNDKVNFIVKSINFCYQLVKIMGDLRLKLLLIIHIKAHILRLFVFSFHCIYYDYWNV